LLMAIVNLGLSLRGWLRNLGLSLRGWLRNLGLSTIFCRCRLLEEKLLGNLLQLV
jgi:hypothetical protein